MLARNVDFITRFLRWNYPYRFKGSVNITISAIKLPSVYILLTYMFILIYPAWFVKVLLLSDTALFLNNSWVSYKGSLNSRFPKDFTTFPYQKLYFLNVDVLTGSVRELTIAYRVISAPVLPILLPSKLSGRSTITVLLFESIHTLISPLEISGE